MTLTCRMKHSNRAVIGPLARGRRSGRGASRFARTMLLAAFVAVSGGHRAGAGPRAWQDPATGLAIGGFDPVAYFTQNQPRAGRRDIELKWGGGVWRFVNPGNRAVFKRHPDVYAPRFGGYDAYSLANGRTTRGHPSIWTRYNNRVYLFHSEVNRQLWWKDRDQIIARAEKDWPTLSKPLLSAIAD